MVSRMQNGDVVINRVTFWIIGVVMSIVIGVAGFSLAASYVNIKDMVHENAVKNAETERLAAIKTSENARDIAVLQSQYVMIIAALEKLQKGQDQILQRSKP